MLCFTKFLSFLLSKQQAPFPSNNIVTISGQVCREWEGTALKVNKDVRLALIRIGVVLGKDGGALGIVHLLSLISLVILFNFIRWY